jgi:NAD(P)H-hydrate epimerase
VPDFSDSKPVQNNPTLWLDQFPFPQRDDNKYTRGSALIYGGAVMTGAARLAARAAQRMGAGLVTLAAEPSVLSIYAAALESVIVKPAASLGAWQELLADPKKNAVLIGPGLGIGAEQKDYVRTALETRKPCVLDADALSNFADNPHALLSQLHAACVLTPHEGEFARLFGKAVDPNAEKISRAQQAAKLSGCVVLLKGAETIIAAPDGAAIINNNAPPWLATGGAGDVLAGMILGLAAQRMPVFPATAAAAWLHGRIAAVFGPGLIAEDLVAGIPTALKDLSGIPGKG